MYLTLAEDPAGHMLAGLDSAVAKYIDGRWLIVSEKNGFSEGTVGSILVDREGLVWFGFLGHGLRKWLGYDQWEHWTKAEGLRSNEIWAMLRDSSGRMWVGDEQGIDILEPGADRFHPWNSPGID